MRTDWLCGLKLGANGAHIIYQRSCICMALAGNQQTQHLCSLLGASIGSMHLPAGFCKAIFISFAY